MRVVCSSHSSAGAIPRHLASRRRTLASRRWSRNPHKGYSLATRDFLEESVPRHAISVGGRLPSGHVRGRSGGWWPQPVRRTTTASPAHHAPRRRGSDLVTNAQAAVLRRAGAAAGRRRLARTGCGRQRWLRKARGGRGCLRPHEFRAGERRRGRRARVVYRPSNRVPRPSSVKLSPTISSPSTIQSRL
jgi:hypothetical protein